MRISKPLALSALTALTLTACSSSGVGDTTALNGVELNVRDDGQPEIIVQSPIETDEDSARVISEGDGEAVNSDYILEYNVAVASSLDGGVAQHTFDSEIPQLTWLPSLGDSEAEQDNFVYDALTNEGVTIGSEVALFLAESEQVTDAQLTIIELLDQYPNFADGEVQEQSGDVPTIENEIGEMPELTDHDGSVEAPTELTQEELISGDGEEVAAEDTVLVQYRGWEWSTGEEFDGSWDAESGNPGTPVSFGLQSVIEGWTEGLSGHQVGDRVLLVVPPEQAYGELEEGQEPTEDGLEGETLIFVVDLVYSIDGETLAQEQAAQQQSQPGPQMSEEEMQELMEEMEQQQQDSAPDNENGGS